MAFSEGKYFLRDRLIGFISEGVKLKVMELLFHLVTKLSVP